MEQKRILGWKVRTTEAQDMPKCVRVPFHVHRIALGLEGLVMLWFEFFSKILYMSLIVEIVYGRKGAPAPQSWVL